MKTALRNLPLSIRIAYTLAVFCFVLPTTGGAPGLVYCIGTDGHQGIEYANGPSCGEHSDAGKTVSSGLGMNSDEHCGPCVDIPLGQVSVAPPDFGGKLANRQFQPPLHVFAALNLIAQHQSFRHRGGSNVAAYPGEVSPVLVALRTTLLQI